MALTNTSKAGRADADAAAEVPAHRVIARSGWLTRGCGLIALSPPLAGARPSQREGEVESRVSAHTFLPSLRAFVSTHLYPPFGRVGRGSGRGGRRIVRRLLAFSLPRHFAYPIQSRVVAARLRSALPSLGLDPPRGRSEVVSRVGANTLSPSLKIVVSIVPSSKPHGWTEYWTLQTTHANMPNPLPPAQLLE